MSAISSNINKGSEDIKSPVPLDYFQNVENALNRIKLSGGRANQATDVNGSNVVKQQNPVKNLNLKQISKTI